MLIRIIITVSILTMERITILAEKLLKRILLGRPSVLCFYQRFPWPETQLSNKFANCVNSVQKRVQVMEPMAEITSVRQCNQR